jgi:hypothetical protein
MGKTDETDQSERTDQNWKSKSVYLTFIVLLLFWFDFFVPNARRTTGPVDAPECLRSVDRFQ